MIYRIRIILDVKEDVFRDIEIEATSTLEDLHHAITQSFGFLGNEMASFYKSNESWYQGEELPLESMENGSNMRDEPLNKIFTSSQHHLIYVYDFLNLWTFFVELNETADIISSSSYPNLIYSKGDVPEEAPEKIFEADNEKELEANDEEEDIDLDYNDSEFY
ncbi:MAG: IS1096 element passenger TnpR family protein [Flavobacteriaceae bacterium]|tara:strand:+ start:10 stop:498 length:489 start_codon:yes stop_codon:yes gene_type:complete